jgi:hypothetical protein
VQPQNPLASAPTHIGLFQARGIRAAPISAVPRPPSRASQDLCACAFILCALSTVRQNRFALHNSILPPSPPLFFRYPSLDLHHITRCGSARKYPLERHKSVSHRLIRVPRCDAEHLANTSPLRPPKTTRLFDPAQKEDLFVRAARPTLRSNRAVADLYGNGWQLRTFCLLPSIGFRV